MLPDFTVKVRTLERKAFSLNEFLHVYACVVALLHSFFEIDFIG